MAQPREFLHLLPALFSYHRRAGRTCAVSPAGAAAWLEGYAGYNVSGTYRTVE